MKRYRIKTKQTCQNCKHKPKNEYALTCAHHINGHVCIEGELWEYKDIKKLEAENEQLKQRIKILIETMGSIVNSAKEYLLNGV